MCHMRTRQLKSYTALWATHRHNNDGHQHRTPARCWCGEASAATLLYRVLLDSAGVELCQPMMCTDAHPHLAACLYRWLGGHVPRIAKHPGTTRHKLGALKGEIMITPPWPNVGAFLDCTATQLGVCWPCMPTWRARVHPVLPPCSQLPLLHRVLTAATSRQPPWCRSTALHQSLRLRGLVQPYSCRASSVLQRAPQPVRHSRAVTASFLTRPGSHLTCHDAPLRVL